MNCCRYRVRISPAAVLASIALLFVFAGVLPAQAQTPTVLYRFAGFNGDACVTKGNIVQGRDGNMYGGGAAACGSGQGTIYKISPAGVESAFFIFPFGWTQCGGAGLTLGSDGNFYGTLADCPVVQGLGCVYKISTAGVFKTIHNFAFTTGAVPCTGLIQGKDGKLYGATQQGALNGNGNIYKMTTAGVATDLHDFNNATDASCVNNIGPPVNLLQVTDGSFSGVNPAYRPNGTAIIYKLTSPDVFSAYIFPNPPIDRDFPGSTLIQNTNGLVYVTTPSGGGSTCFGGACFGTFFSVATGDKPFLSLEPTEKSGNVGAKVGIFGQGFSSASVGKFGGVAATSVTLSGATYLTAVVPAGAHTGTVTVTTGATTLTSPQTYKVKPKITSFSPSSGPPTTLVSITGTGLIPTRAVKL